MEIPWYLWRAERGLKAIIRTKSVSLERCFFILALPVFCSWPNITLLTHDKWVMCLTPVINTNANPIKLTSETSLSSIIASLGNGPLGWRLLGSMPSMWAGPAAERSTQLLQAAYQVWGGMGRIGRDRDPLYLPISINFREDLVSYPVRYRVKSYPDQFL